MLNDYAKAYVAEIREALKTRVDLTDKERYLLESEIVFIEEGTISLTGPDTVEERLERYRNHYP